MPQDNYLILWYLIDTLHHHFNYIMETPNKSIQHKLSTEFKEHSYFFPELSRFGFRLVLFSKEKNNSIGAVSYEYGAESMALTLDLTRKSLTMPLR